VTHKFVLKQMYIQVYFIVYISLHVFLIEQWQIMRYVPGLVPEQASQVA